MRNLHKLLIVLISVAFVASGVFAQTSYLPAPKLADQSKQKVKPASPYSSYLSVGLADQAIKSKQANADLQIAGIVETEVSSKEFNEDELKKLNQLGFNVNDLNTEEGIANAEKLLSENMVSQSSPLLSTFSSNAIKNTDETVTVTIGIGTDVSGTYDTDITPFGTYYHDGQNQFLFSATELAIAGVGAGDMTEIGWHVETAAPDVMAGFNIEVKHTDATSVTGFETDFTNVYSGDYTAVAGWNMFTFSSPFAYDGSQNLLVKVCFDNEGYTTNSLVYYSLTDVEMTASAYNDNGAGCSDPWETSILERPNTRITGEEATGVPPAYPFDEMPISGTFDVPIDGDLMWTFGNNTETYDLWLGPVGAMVLVVEGADATTGAYTYALDYAMGYEWQVVGYNEFGSTAGPVWNFVTACAVVTAPFNEDFSIWPPVCWDLTGGTNEWVHYTTGVECAEAGFWGQSAGSTDYMTSGTIDISGGNFGLEFFWSHTYNTSYPDDALEVLVSDDDGATWTQVWYKIGEELESNDGAGNTDPGTFVSSDIISLGAFGDEIKLQFIGWSGWGPDLFIDDISVFDVAYGILDGTVTDLATSSPIEGAVVDIDGMTATTGADGTYSIDGVLVGDYDVTITADGFNPTMASVTILDGVTTTQDFAMTAPTMDIDPLAINVTIDPNGMLTEIVDITNNGDGALAWNAQIEMLEDNSAKGSMAYAIDLSNTSAVSFDTDVPGTFNTLGTVSLSAYAGDFDNVNVDFFYVMDNSDYSIHTVDVGTGVTTLLTATTGMTAGHTSTGMACDKTTGMMYVASTDGAVSHLFSLDLETGVLTFIGDTGIPAIIEMAVNGAGVLYAWDIINDEAFTIDKATGVSTLLGPLGFDLNYAQGGSWDPASDVIYLAAYTTSGVLLTMDQTTGACTLVGDLQGGAEVGAMGFPGGGGPVWLSIDPNSGDVDAGNTGMMDVNFDATDLFAGTTKNANIHFSSTPDVGMVTVSVSMTVGDQEFGYIEGNVMLDGAEPYNMGDVEEVEVWAGAYMAYPDEDGDYMIEVYPGTYDVTTTLYGYEPQTISDVTVAEGTTVSDVDFVMPTTYGSIMGTVTDAENGDPISGVTIMVLNTDFETMTAADGTYEIFIEAGTYDIYANHDLYTPQTAAEVVIMAEMDTEQNFELEYSLACEFSVVLTDDYGDGWNGNTLTISVDGVPVLENIALATGSGPETWYFETATGSEVLCEYSGTVAQWDYENEYHIFDNDNEEVFSDGVGGVAPVGGSFTSQCIVFIYGDLAGTVTELETGNPVEGAVIMVDDMEGISGADGTYLIETVMVGVWDATCNAMGYNIEMESVEIFEEMLTEQDFVLTAPTIDVDPTSISITLEPNEMADEMVTITNNGNGPLDWGAQVQFMDGNSAKGSMAYAIDLSNTSAVSFDTDVPGTFNTIGTVSLSAYCGDFDNVNTDFYYVMDNSDYSIHTVDVETGATSLHTTTTGMASGHTSTGMACDKSTGVMYVASTDGAVSNLYTLDLETGVITTVGATGIPAIIEIAVNGAGTLYAWDIINDEAFTVDKETGASTLLGPLGFDLNYAQGGSWDPESDVIYMAAYTTAGVLLTMDQETGACTLIGDLQGGAEVGAMGFPGGTAAWLSIDPNGGMLDAGNDAEMTAHFDATELLPGVYEAEIHFGSSPDVGSPVINVTMTVEGLIPAIELMAGYDCTDVELMWEMPTGGDPDSWDVYRDDELVGTADEMSYTDMMVMPEMEYTYTVVAVYGSEEAQPSSPAIIMVPVPADLDPYDAEAMTDTPNENEVTIIWEVPEACVAPDSYSVYKNGEMIADGITVAEYVDGPLNGGVYEYYVVAVYYFGESDASNAAYAVITGVEDYDASMFQVFPNPAAEIVNVKSPVTIDRVYVLNSNGQLVLDEEVNSMEYKINVSKYDTGIYFIKFETSEGVILRKVAIK